MYRHKLLEFKVALTLPLVCVDQSILFLKLNLPLVIAIVLEYLGKEGFSSIFLLLERCNVCCVGCCSLFLLQLIIKGSTIGPQMVVCVRGTCNHVVLD